LHVENENRLLEKHPYMLLETSSPLKASNCVMATRASHMGGPNSCATQTSAAGHAMERSNIKAASWETMQQQWCAK
jgi:hypothetical protein